MSDLILKERAIKKYKTTEREIFVKYDNLSEDELNTKSKQNAYVENDALMTVIKSCRGEKKRRKKNRWTEKKVNDSRI